MPQSKDRHREYMRDWYQQNKAAHVRMVRKSEAARIGLYMRRIDEMKSEPCTDCGQIFDPVCMDFDHLRDKEFNISHMVRNNSWDKILAELAKCELVCSNCHRLRTRTRWLAEHPVDVVWLESLDAE
jgi:hypothetical protein